MKCVGVIVTYNRKELLVENMRMLRRQTKLLDSLIVIDNHSTDGTEEYIKKETVDYPVEIDYRYMDENYGGAGGFYYGVKYAFEANADLIWLMDDDGRPFLDNTFEKIFHKAVMLCKKNRLLFINSLVTYDGKNLSFGFWPDIEKARQSEKIEAEKEDNVLYGVANPFNGTLISRETVEKIGFPRKEFFRKRDEWDYMNRAAIAGALVATVVDSVYYHPEAKVAHKKIIKFIVPIYDGLDDEYYTVRNYYYATMATQKRKAFSFVIMRLLAVVMYENQKGKRLKQIKQAISDAKAGNMGKKL